MRHGGGSPPPRPGIELFVSRLACCSRLPEGWTWLPEGWTCQGVKGLCTRRRRVQIVAVRLGPAAALSAPPPRSALQAHGFCSALRTRDLSGSSLSLLLRPISSCLDDFVSSRGHISLDVAVPDEKKQKRTTETQTFAASPVSDLVSLCASASAPRMDSALVVLAPRPVESPAACCGLVGWQAPGLGETGEAVVPSDSLGLILALPLSDWPWAPGCDDPSLSRVRQDKLPDRVISSLLFDSAGLESLGMTLESETLPLPACPRGAWDRARRPSMGCTITTRVL